MLVFLQTGQNTLSPYFLNTSAFLSFNDCASRMKGKSLSIISAMARQVTAVFVEASSSRSLLVLCSTQQCVDYEKQTAPMIYVNRIVSSGAKDSIINS